MITLSYKKYAPLVTLPTLLLAMGGIAWFGILPLGQSLEEKMRGIKEFYAGRENRERQVNRLPELEMQYEVIQADGKMLRILVTEDGVVDFVKTLERLAAAMNVGLSISSKDNGAIIERAKPAAQKPGQAKAETANPAADKPASKPVVVDILADVPFDRYLYLSVTVAGQYADIVAFLRRMETLPFALDVVKVEMKKHDAEGDASLSAAGSALNPFAMLGGTGNASGTEATVAPVAGPDIVEAVFDTVVYVDKN